MLSSIRRISKSRVGALIGVVFLALIVASFALGDIQNVLSGGTSLPSNQLASVGSQTITDRDIDRAMQMRLQQIRQQNPEADYSMLAGEFDQILAAMIDEKAIAAYADETGFDISKRLIDAQIATIPGARGLTGQFTEQAYATWLAQQRLTDADVREIIRNGLLQQLMISPVAANSRVPVGMARPYASMLLEQREGQVALVPIAAYRSGLNPSDQDVQQYYAANRARYTVPQQRVLRFARIGEGQVQNVAATDQEIADYYRSNQAQYAARDIRVISQAVLPDRSAAEAVANRARGGASFAAAASPAGLSAQDVSVGPQTREQFTSLAGSAVANAAFQAPDDGIVGPIQSDLGWHVVKIEEIRREGGQTLAQARDEIAKTLTDNKRKEALTDLVTRVEDDIADGASLTEAARNAGLQIEETPLILADGTSRTNPDFNLADDLRAALRAGFEVGENEEPVVETLPNDSGYVLVAASRLVPATPAPLADIRERVANDWINAQAIARARTAAKSVADRASQASLADAVAAANARAQVEPISARRMQLSQFQGRVPPPLALLFSLGQGKARMIAGSEGEGFYVVKVNRIVPGNAQSTPTLISQTQRQMQETVADEYARQFFQAVRNFVGVKRNESAIAEARQRITGRN